MQGCLSRKLLDPVRFANAPTSRFGSTFPPNGRSVETGGAIHAINSYAKTREISRMEIVDFYPDGEGINVHAMFDATGM